MRIAIITDIHEDFQMLENAIERLKSIGYDILVCLGDITGYTREFYDHKPDANACIEIIRENAEIVIAGNHDLFNSKRLPSYHKEKNIPDNWYDLTLSEQQELSNNNLWLYEGEVIPNLTRQNTDYLKSLGESETIENGISNILFTHFLKPDISGIGKWLPYRIRELSKHFKLMEENNCKLAFVGHSHPNGVTLAGKLFWSAPRYDAFKMKQNSRIVLCPAIAGGKKPGSCIIFDTKSYEITPYLIK